MKDDFAIREFREADRSEIEAFYPQAFPDEDLLPLVRQLLDDEAATHLVCEQENAIVGHVACSRCSVSCNDNNAALLGPLAVHPDHQRSGIGSALVTSGIEEVKKAGAAVVLVLGDPAYYKRFGFVAEQNIEPPYQLPDDWSDAWQSLYVGDENSGLAGRLAVPEPWEPKALWLP